LLCVRNRAPWTRQTHDPFQVRRDDPRRGAILDNPDVFYGSGWAGVQSKPIETRETDQVEVRFSGVIALLEGAAERLLIMTVSDNPPLHQPKSFQKFFRSNRLLQVSTARTLVRLATRLYLGLSSPIKWRRSRPAPECAAKRAGFSIAERGSDLSNWNSRDIEQLARGFEADLIEHLLETGTFRP
jgi:hypothetical protein